MPYNNTPIAPSKEITGHVSLPRKSTPSALAAQPSNQPQLTPPSVARVQKIITADPARLTVAKNGAFAIALATEMFIQHLATTTHNVVKTERKPRRNIQYRDVSSAVAKTDNLEFAVDVVPKTMVYKEAKRRGREREEREKEREKEGQEKEDQEVDGVQADAHKQTATSPPPAAAALPKQDDAMDVDERVQQSEPDEEDPAAMQLEMEMRGPPRSGDKSPEQKTQAPKSPEQKMHAPQSPERAVKSPEQQPPATRRSTGGFTSINGAK
jgi:DNA polymerase epsilon subunit 4